MEDGLHHIAEGKAGVEPLTLTNLPLHRVHPSGAFGLLGYGWSPHFPPPLPISHLQGPTPGSLTSHMQVGSYRGPLDMSTGLGLMFEMRRIYLGVWMETLFNRELNPLAAIERQEK